MTTERAAVVPTDGGLRRVSLLSRASWLLPVLIVFVAVGRAMSATPKMETVTSDEASRAFVFHQINIDEGKFRRDAAKDFPADPWSQDDAFHNLEYKRLKELAPLRGMSFSEALRSADDGLRKKWSDSPVMPGVVPCKPRPIY